VIIFFHFRLPVQDHLFSSDTHFVMIEYVSNIDDPCEFDLILFVIDNLGAVIIYFFVYLFILEPFPLT
jgi:hypothetical protein